MCRSRSLDAHVGCAQEVGRAARGRDVETRGCGEGTQHDCLASDGQVCSFEVCVQHAICMCVIVCGFCVCTGVHDSFASNTPCDDTHGRTHATNSQTYLHMYMDTYISTQTQTHKYVRTCRAKGGITKSQQGFFDFVVLPQLKSFCKVRVCVCLRVCQ